MLLVLQMFVNYTFAQHDIISEFDDVEDFIGLDFRTEMLMLLSNIQKSPM